ncbi:nitrogenase component 1 [Anaeromicropila populeti]|uniref:Nitrogenase molybdenum-iron protein beta chain n=1 Tax=Anaeromicropila populeti TaxID=37658 RepID=A0A1I6HST2_9FIRM|nr:nitrogenase component 1 [Anaeromicropila populeti]SFR57522.1 nitrogenase molybdenum-iron protein beta chain [Anaeromicropila populeti]
MNNEIDNTVHKKCLDSIEKCGILGVSQVMAQIKNASVVIHGPRGCVFPAYEASIVDNLNFSYTEMCRRSTIFGGENDVAEKILDEYYENHPSTIAVVTTCGSQIIGDDIKGSINKLDLQIPVICIEGGSFTNSQIKGLNKTMYQIVKSICRKNSNPQQIINIFATVGKSYTWKEDARQLKALLHEFGVEARVLFLDAEIEEIKEYSDAILNVMLDQNYGKQCAEYMKEAFSIPYIQVPYPIGLKNSEKFVQKVIQACNMEVLDLEEKLMEKRTQARNKFLSSLGRVNTFRHFESIKRLTKAIAAYEDISFGLLELMIHELEDSVDYVVIKTTDLDKKEEIKQYIEDNYSVKEILVTNDRTEVITFLQTHEVQVLFGSDVEYYAVRNNQPVAYVNIEYPGTYEIHMKDESYTGFLGTLNFIENYYNKIVNAHKMI